MTVSYTHLDVYKRQTYSYMKEKYPFMTYDAVEEIVTVSDYNKVAKLLGLDTYTLDSDEYLVIADYDNMVSVRNAALGLNTPIIIDGKTCLLYTSRVKKYLIF